jgi:ferredoxin-NADP reductase
MTELYTENKVIYYKGSFGTKYYIPESDTLICNNQPVVLKNVIMFSCGTGITPFYSILTNVQPNTKYNFKLFASFRHREEAVLVNDFEKHTKLYISSEGNRMTAAECSDIVSNYGSSTIVLVCGTREYNGMIINECAGKNVLSYVF